MNTHQPVRTWIRIASENPISGLLAMADQTSMNQTRTSRSRNLILSQIDIGLRVSRSSSLGRPLGGGGGGGGGTPGGPEVMMSGGWAMSITCS